MLPGLDGIAVCRKVRERHITPILMLTARGEEADIVLGLEVGADDYLTKPFRMRELLARVRAMLRRVELLAGRTRRRGAAAGEDDRVASGAIAISPAMRTATVDGDEIELTPKEFDLLALFVRNPGRAFSRDYLLERIWGNEYEVTDRTVDTHVQRLRKKLGDDAEADPHRLGHRLQAPAAPTLASPRPRRRAVADRPPERRRIWTVNSGPPARQSHGRRSMPGHRGTPSWQLPAALPARSAERHRRPRMRCSLRWRLAESHVAHRSAQRRRDQAGRCSASRSPSPSQKPMAEEPAREAKRVADG